MKVIREITCPFCLGTGDVADLIAIHAKPCLPCDGSGVAYLIDSDGTWGHEFLDVPA